MKNKPNKPIQSGEKWEDEFASFFKSDHMPTIDCFDEHSITLEDLKAWISKQKLLWEQTERERVIEEVIKKIEDYVWLAPFSDKTRIRVKGLREVLDSLSAKEKENQK